ncbi:hypothetical protein QSJ18_01820 [Gordonia sp. ABSL1-1]|uniref:hypothetical protein n=1 Tax=Gordonia sp. ABSL1-1 TaxID=3053923 RepID=UPI0025729D04|nr:hypothetical protein [Gordonia sp. ABSL1-1]MDL9935476.1 hypothetical protein [Gordonia sp. ABSL1-1]
MQIAEVPPGACPNGHPFTLGLRTHLVGWDNQHDPPCRVYQCRRCGARLWIVDPVWRSSA